MQTSDAIRRRKSVRSFTSESINSDILTNIIEEAQRAPSWANSQPWSVYIAMGDTLKLIKKTYNDRLLAGKRGQADFETVHRNSWSWPTRQNMQHWNNQLSSVLENDPAGYMHSAKTLYNAPAIIYLVLDERPTSWSIYDLGSFSQTLMLSATDHGLQTMPAYELIKYPDVLRNTLSIPDNMTVAMGIAIGHEDKTALINNLYTDRVPVNSILHIVD